MWAPGMLAASAGHEIHELFERQPLLGARVGPERAELPCAIEVPDAEEVLQSALFQRIAFHVEEHVARVRRRHAEETAARVRVQREHVDESAAFHFGPDLQSCLVLQPLERLRGHLGDAEFLQCCKVSHSGRPARHQPGDLDAGDVRHLGEVVVV